jgi:hypothetical protein
MRVAYTIGRDGLMARGISEYWIVVRGAYYFSFSCGYSPNDPPETRAAILGAIESVRIGRAR